MEGAFFFAACASGGRKADCAALLAWEPSGRGLALLLKQGLGVREEVGVLRPWGEGGRRRPAFRGRFFVFARRASAGGFIWALMEGDSLPPR